MGGELAVELGEQCDTVGEAKLGTGRRKRGVLRGCCAVDDEARAWKRLEQGGKRGITDPVMRPGNARAHGERGLGIEQQQSVEAPTQFASGIGRAARVKAECEAAAGEIGFAVGRRVEVLRLDRGVA